jgi:hypothetical protein
MLAGYPPPCQCGLNFLSYAGILDRCPTERYAGNKDGSP